MMCPVCKRDLAPTLSICLTCGAMVRDTVREELETKISRTPSGNLKTSKTVSGELTMPRPEVQEPLPKTDDPIKPPIAKPLGTRFDTSGLHAKKTSPTLVEFQTPKATVPEWRLQLQNSVRQKAGPNRRTDQTSEPAGPAQQKHTSGANALKIDFVEDEQPARHQNPRVANALKRIEESRKTFSTPAPGQKTAPPNRPATRNHPFNVVARSNAPVPATPKPLVNASPKPVLVSPMKIEKKKYDTNKLPPLEKTAQKADRHIPEPIEDTRRRWEILSVEEQQNVAPAELPELDLIEVDEIEDLAPLSMRFGAGIFDLIVGFFAGLLILSPFMITGGNWFSLAGGLAIAATVAIVMFLYLTLAIAFIGRTVGMRLFSLELVDVEENSYPTLHQAAVNSSVYLLGLPLLGLGFLPVFFNEERRAAHDILSSTILIREL